MRGSTVYITHVYSVYVAMTKSIILWPVTVGADWGVKNSGLQVDHTSRSGNVPHTKNSLGHRMRGVITGDHLLLHMPWSHMTMDIFYICCATRSCAYNI